MLAQARIYRYPRERIEKMIEERLEFYYADEEVPSKASAKGKSGK